MAREIRLLAKRKRGLWDSLKWKTRPHRTPRRRAGLLDKAKAGRADRQKRSRPDAEELQQKQRAKPDGPPAGWGPACRVRQARPPDPAGCCSAFSPSSPLRRARRPRSRPMPRRRPLPETAAPPVDQAVPGSEDPPPPEAAAAEAPAPAAGSPAAAPAAPEGDGNDEYAPAEDQERRPARGVVTESRVRGLATRAFDALLSIAKPHAGRRAAPELRIQRGKRWDADHPTGEVHKRAPPEFPGLISALV